MCIRDRLYVEAIRKALGENDFMLDVGLIWDAKTTIKRSKQYEPFNLFWIEEPLHPDNYTGYGELSKNCVQHIAAGEEECTLRGFKQLIDVGKINIAQIDVTRCGITQAMKIANYANLCGIKVCNHNFTTDINSSASLHFLCSIPNSLVMEYCNENGEISRKLSKNPVKIIIRIKGSSVSAEDVMNHLYFTTDLERSYRANLNIITFSKKNKLADVVYLGERKNKNKFLCKFLIKGKIKFFLIPDYLIDFKSFSRSSKIFTEDS